MPSTAIQLALPNTIPSQLDNPNDRGECLVLDTDTMTRCDGRMVASIRETTPFLPGFPVWTCDKCGKVVVP